MLSYTPGTPRARSQSRVSRTALLVSCLLALTACGGGGGSTGSSPPPTPASKTYSATSGVAQKGPLILGSTVTAQELDATLSPTGQQYSYQITSNLGTFTPTSTFSSQYIGLIATGYYFDEVQNQISSGTITLNAYDDLSAESVLNVNLLTTLAYQRIQKLVGAGMTFSAAQTQAETEVLEALNVPNGSYYGAFGALDISKGTDGDNILTAVSSLFVFGNTAGTLSSLIANFQNDLGNNGTITSPQTKAALAAAAAAINPATIAANLTQEYASAGVTFQPGQIVPWIDQDGSGVVGQFKFQVTNATSSSTLTLPALISQASAGQSVSVTAGQLIDNGTPVGGSVTLGATDSLTISPGTSAFGSNGVLTAFLMSGSTKLARVLFISPTADVWLPATPMVSMRTYAPAVALQNGQVLISGGVSPNSTVYGSSELYDPAVNVWSPSGNLVSARYLHTATVLTNGKVLIAAGYASDENTALQSAEVFDPSSGTWTATGNLAAARIEHTATLLPNGQVLVAGGLDPTSNTALASAELYDPTTGTWSAAASMANARNSHTATLLQNGMVLVAGGSNGGTILSSAELYDPSSNTWSPAGALSTARTIHTATLLQSGLVLLVGGEASNASLASTDLYNPSTNTFSASGNMATARYGHAAALLPSGMVMAAGGELQTSGNTTITPLASAELYDPTSGTWAPAASMASARGFFATATITGGGVLVAGGQAVNSTGGTILGAAEIYW